VRYGVVIVLARIGATQFSESKLLKIYEKMKTAKTPPAANRTVESSLGLDRINLEAIGGGAVRYGLVIVLAWIGAMKFTAYEAGGIKGLVENSPLMSFGYHLFSVRGFSNLIGATEILIGLLIAARPWSARASVLGSALAVAMFATTLSFLLSTPGVWEPSSGGFPALSALPGQFLLKDLVLFGAAVWSFGEAWKHRLCGREIAA